MMISTSIILSTGEKKCTPMKFFGSFDCSASEVIGKRRGVGAEHDLVADDGLRLGGRLRLHLAVLEHRFDDHVDALERVVVRRRRDAREQLVRVFLLGAAALDLARHDVRRIGLALVGRLLVAVDQHHLDAGLRRHVGDAGAHQAGAEHADLLQVEAGGCFPAGARPCSAPASRRTASGSSRRLRASARPWRNSATRCAARCRTAPAGPRRRSS